jgi:hypothetical protein
MKIKNISARVYFIGDFQLAPGQIAELPESIKDKAVIKISLARKELEIVKDGEVTATRKPVKEQEDAESAKTDQPIKEKK